MLLNAFFPIRLPNSAWCTKSEIVVNTLFGKTAKHFAPILKKCTERLTERRCTDLGKSSEKWCSKYRHAIESWRNNWDALTNYFDFPLQIRKIIYTTNTIENLNRGIRKYTKTKVQFTDEAAQKAVYLGMMNIEKIWSMPIQNWG